LDVWDSPPSLKGAFNKNGFICSSPTEEGEEVEEEEV
jgi:hypothetical protein